MSAAMVLASVAIAVQDESDALVARLATTFASPGWSQVSGHGLGAPELAEGPCLRLHGPEQRAYKRRLREAAREKAGALKPHHPLSLLDEAVFAFVGEAFAAGIEVGAAAAGLHRALNRHPAFATTEDESAVAGAT